MCCKWALERQASFSSSLKQPGASYHSAVSEVLQLQDETAEDCYGPSAMLLLSTHSRRHKQGASRPRRTARGRDTGLARSSAASFRARRVPAAQREDAEHAELASHG